MSMSCPCGTGLDRCLGTHRVPQRGLAQPQALRKISPGNRVADRDPTDRDKGREMGLTVVTSVAAP